MPSTDRSPQTSRPPEAEGGMTTGEAPLMNDSTPGGANAAVGAPCSRRSQLLTVTGA